MFNAVAGIATYFGLIALQFFLAWRIVCGDRKVLTQLLAMACVAAVAAAIWYALETQFGWSVPTRRGLAEPLPRRDAVFMFAIGWIGYAYFFINTGRPKR